jgi:hypothetical protein
VINPFLVFDQYNGARKGKDAVVLDDEDFVGWCILDSVYHSGSKLDHQGLHGTMGNRYKAKYGVRLFLNVCASYLKGRAMRNEGLITEEDCFQYDEPFGPYTEYRGTVGFPRFDIVAPSILSQSNSCDCGVAVVANSMAFVKSYNKAKFVKGNMKLSLCSILPDADLIGVIFVFKDREYCSQKKIWTKVIADGNSRRYSDDEEIITSQDVLAAMRREYIEIVDEIAADSVTDGDQKRFDEVVSHLKSLDTDTRKDQGELSFHQRKMMAYQASRTKSALKEKIAQGELMTEILHVDSDSDDGRTKPSFYEKVTIASDAVDTKLSGRDMAQAIGVGDRDEQGAQLMKASLKEEVPIIAADVVDTEMSGGDDGAMAKVKEDETQHDTVDDLHVVDTVISGGDDVAHGSPVDDTDEQGAQLDGLPTDQGER